MKQMTLGSIYDRRQRLSIYVSRANEVTVILARAHVCMHVCVWFNLSRKSTFMTTFWHFFGILLLKNYLCTTVVNSFFDVMLFL